MKVVFMGTPDFAVGALEAIIKAGHQVTAVVTQPDKPKGRGKEMQITPVKACALKYDIPVFQPVKIKTPEAIEQLRTYEADIFVVAAFGQLLSEEILNMPKFGCVNIHASLLPKYRGAGPIQWVILDGEKETGITIMQMDKGLDTGDMLFSRKVPIAEKETGDSLHDKLAQVGAELIVEALPKIEAGEVTPVKQNDADSCYAKMLQKSMGKIDWTKQSVEIERLVRGLNSWPSAYTSYHGKTLKIWASDISDKTGEGIVLPTEVTEVVPGMIVAVEKDAVYVKTGDGSLKLTEVQLEGKKRMPVKNFLLGYQVKVGEMLGQ
ncbi:MAG: methionyl-tRNA formyltransferase [Lachnospiraceae bacterium]|nr:methionyl-tRNA formyltransferase [Lachnospiraceae bacterium]